MDQKKPKKRHDLYKIIKFLGYRLSQLPGNFKRVDLVRYAKFQLASKTKTLLKDPIWDSYTEEEILIEWFAHQFNDDKEFRGRFEDDLGDIDGSVDEFAAWADREIAKENKVRDNILSGTEDKVSFDPSQVMGEDE